MKIIKKIILLFGIWFIIISGCIFVGWESYKLKQDVDLVKSRIEQVSFNSQIMFKNIQSSNKRSTNIQEQIAKIQDFEDRRYNAITAQLNSFWSGVNGFLALIGVFFAMFSWYLVRQVESATKNINKLEKLEQNINDAIAKKSFALYENNIKQDISQIIQSVKDSKNQEMITSAYDLLKLRINYIEMSAITDLYNSFSSDSVQLKQDRPSFYYNYLSYYLVLMLFKDYKKIPDNLINELIDILKSNASLLMDDFVLLNNLCNVDKSIGKRFGDRISEIINLKILYFAAIDGISDDRSYLRENISSLFERWFGYIVNVEE
jgi:predicted PurR-regulated permease PerM